MATIKVTFTLDEVAIQQLTDAAERLCVPKSEVVREAIMDFYDRLGRLSERERTAMLRVFDEMVPEIPVGGTEEVERELAEIRHARGSGGRLTPSDRK